MSLTNAQFALALAAAIDDFHNGVTDEAGLAAAVDPLLDGWALGGASVATAAKLSSDAVAGLNTFVEQAVDWYAGTDTGGPDSDGFYPLTDTAGNTYSVPSPAKLIADLGGITPKGHVADVASLPASGNAVGDFYTVAGVGNDPNRIYGWGTGGTWLDLGQFQGAQGPTGDEAALVEMQNFAGLAHKRLDSATPRRGQVTIANEASGSWFTTSGGTAVISLDPPMDRDDYAVRLRVRSATPSTAQAGPVEVVSQAVNAFTVRVPGSARDVVIDWHVTA